MSAPAIARAKKLLRSAAALETGNQLEAAAKLYRGCDRILPRNGVDRDASALLLRSLHGLARVCHQLGRHDQSESTYRRALGIAERVAGPDSGCLCVLLGGCASLFMEQGRFPEAGQLYQRSLMIAEKAYGPSDLRIAAIYHELASLEHAAGNFLRAESFALHALKIRKKSLGAGHAELAY